MVKIKEGYIMSPKEKQEYERVNALPRKTSGTVGYYFKRQTKYPPRIYLFMHAEIWCDRNRRPMGLHTAFPFLTRPMNSEEIEYHHFDTRLCYHQYEDWDKLLFAEEKEADQLDKENLGGSAFLDQLKSFREKYPLKAKEREVPPVPPGELESEEMRYFRKLFNVADTLTTAEISELLDNEQRGEKRPLILTLLRECYKNTAVENKVALDAEKLQRRVSASQSRNRKNFVRRIYRRNPLFALQEIADRYPDYDHTQLQSDLHIKSRKSKRKKTKPILDLRRCQLQKLANHLQNRELNDQEYHETCNKIVLLQNAHDRRLPIPLPVKLQGQTLVYDFNWKTRERIVKDFVNLANTKDMTHDILKERYQEITRSPASI